MVALSILTCSFFIILYSLEWGAKRANEWLMTMLLSFGQSILVIDPLKVFLITAVISFLIRKPYDDETLDFNDPFTGTLLSNNNIAENEQGDLYNDTRVKGKDLFCFLDEENYLEFVFFNDRNCSTTSCSFI